MRWILLDLRDGIVCKNKFAIVGNFSKHTETDNSSPFYFLPYLVSRIMKVTYSAQECELRRDYPELITPAYLWREMGGLVSQHGNLILTDRAALTSGPAKNVRRRWQVIVNDNEQTLIGLYRSKLTAINAMRDYRGPASPLATLAAATVNRLELVETSRHYAGTREPVAESPSDYLSLVELLDWVESTQSDLVHCRR